MALQGRTETTPVRRAPLEEDLLGSAHAFDFGQAVRLLRTLHPDRKGVGEFSLPSEEVVRFSSNPSLAFPAGAVQEATGKTEDRVRLVVNFLGLIGNTGVLPLYYSRLVADQEREGREGLRDFLDIFQHRLISFFYRSWENTHFFIPFERRERDPMSARLLEMIGLESTALRDRIGVPDEDLLFYAGLLGIKQRSAASLQRIIEDYFDVKANVDQFVGGWYQLTPESVSVLDDEADELSPGLGRDIVVGDEIWDPQARVRIRIGPLSRDRFEQFLPGGDAHSALPMAVPSREGLQESF